MTMTITPQHEREEFVNVARSERGWVLFPIAKGKQHPREWEKTSIERYSSERLCQAPEVGVVLDTSGLAVIDIDVQSGGSVEAVEERFGTLPVTYTVRTPSGGWHYYFAIPDGVDSDTLGKIIGKLIPGVDFLCKECYVAAPTSMREAGEKKPAGVYVVERDVPVAELPGAILAAWVRFNAAKKPATVNTVAETHPSRFADVKQWHQENVETAESTPDGQRDDEVTKQIFASVSLALGVPDDVLSVADVERDYGQLNYDVKDLAGKIERALDTVSARTFGARIDINDPVSLDYWPDKEHLSTPEARSDASQIDRITDMLAGRVISTRAGWLAWNGTHWEMVDSIAWIVKEACKLAWLDMRLVSEPTSTQIKTVSHWNTPGFWAAAEGALKDEPRLKKRAGELDAKPHLLTVRNGTVDLRTGELRPHDRNNYLTKVTEIDYDPSAAFPRFDQFLSEIFPTSPEMPAYLQRFLGYAIAGETSVHIYPVWAGVGRNGKSVLIDAVRAVLGGYAVNVRTQALEQGGNAQETELSRMRGARLAVLSETNAGMRVDEAELKKWTGDTTMTARDLYSKAFEYERQFQVIQITNHEPRFMSQGLALWERVRLVKFNRVFEAHEQDETLPVVLRSDAAKRAILAWMVKGAVDFYRERKLIQMPEIEESTSEYRAEQNPLDEFLNSKQVVKGPDEWAKGSDLYQAYAAFADREAVKRNTFFDLLTENGFEKARRGSHGRGFRGLSLRGGRRHDDLGDAF